MQKRKIAVLIAAVLLSAQAGLAAAGESANPLGAAQIRAMSEPPVQSTFQEQHAAAASEVSGDAIPADAEAIVGRPLPAQEKYFEEHAVVDQATATSLDAIPPGAEELVWKMLPAQAAYFDHQAERTTTSAYGTALDRVN